MCPEQDTDFIFCTVGEEQGFVGSAAVLLAFLILILETDCFIRAADFHFARVYGYSVVSIFLFHLLLMSDGAWADSGNWYSFAVLQLRRFFLVGIHHFIVYLPEAGCRKRQKALIYSPCFSIRIPTSLSPVNFSSCIPCTILTV